MMPEQGGGLGGLGRPLVTHLLKAHGESRVLLIGRRAASAVAAEREALGWGAASRVDYAEVDLGGVEGVAALGAAIASFLQAATLCAAGCNPMSGHSLCHTHDDSLGAYDCNAGA